MTMNSEASVTALPDRAWAEDLLQRYPAINEREAELLVLFLKKGPSIDVALTKSDDAFRPKIELFIAERPQDFDTRLRDYAIIACVIVAFFLLCYSLAGIGR